MSTTRRSAQPTPEPGDVAARLQRAEFVRVLARTDGDAVAAAGLLARALDRQGTPFQVSPTDSRAQRARRIERSGGEATTIAIGTADAADVTIADAEASTTAAAIVRELDEAPNPVLTLAGSLATGDDPGDHPDLLATAREQGIERRPGVGVPTTDLADGLAHSMAFRAPFSGDRDAAAEALDAIDVPTETDDDADRRAVASLVAIEATSGRTPERAAEAIERVLRPHGIAGAFATVEGYADVLDSVAREQPGTAIALALGADVADAALDAWRTHARRLHRGLDDAQTGRYDGLFVVHVGTAPTASAARLVCDTESPEPIVLAIGETEASLAARDDHDVRAATDALAEATDGSADGTARLGTVRFERTPDEIDLIDVVRGEP